ncbi:tetratricopeptide repeat protein [Pedosphaera parvula]|uniref:Tetratricopeptide TPR_2 repeat protein n=1 Tax=Pedosphaera parvula (strain Ellin514) TaxID=320771 RepID=B9XNS8_PEDPL|nr:tetratricopeptide repeat protein [Pedosphaera parvula]EEF58501.1 Tetratricopeptide TPR_2 repeat protein [Pedosphaera parvula Ellin514]
MRTRLFLILFLLVCAVFYPVLSAEFLPWDDDANIYLNPHLTGLGLDQLKWISTDTTYVWRYQPLCWFTWSAIKACFGLKPFYFHLIVLLFHAANTGLVFLLIHKLLLLARNVARETAPPQFAICAALGAAFWGVHPLRVESTAWAVELAYVQPLFFFLLSIFSYLRAAEVKNPKLYVGLSMLLFIISLMSFPLALGGFVVFWGLNFFPLRRLELDPARWLSREAFKVWAEQFVFLAIAVFFGWLNLRIRSHPASTMWSNPASLAEFGFASRVMQGFFIWAYYIWKPFLPFNLTPVPIQLLEFKPLDLPFLLSAILVVGLSLILFLRRRLWPGIFVIWICYLALLVPVLGISEHPHYPSDRYSLVVSIGWSILLSALLAKLWAHLRLRQLLLGASTVTLLLFASMSYQQTFMWQTSVGFFQAILRPWKDEPKLASARLNLQMRLAQAHVDHGQFTNAVEVLREAIQIKPAFAEGHHQLGNALKETGDLDGASASYAEAMRLAPDLMPSLNDLGVAYAQLGKLDQAMAQFSKVMQREPENASAIKNMAIALQMKGRTNEAEVYLIRLKTLPSHPSGLQ